MNWFLVLIIAILLVIGGVEVNPGPGDEDVKMIMNMLGGMKDEMNKRFEENKEEMKKRFETAERRTEGLHGEWMGLKNEVNDLSNQMKEMKKELSRIDAIEKDIRSRNVVIYGIDTKHMENKYDTVYRLMEIFINQMNMRLHEDSIDNCFWLGRRKGKRPLLVKFTRGSLGMRYLKGPEC